MKEIGLKTRIVVNFAGMLTMAMCLQSLVFVFLGVRNSIRDDISWAKHVLQSYVLPADHQDAKRKRVRETAAFDTLVPEDYAQIFSCIHVEGDGASLVEFPSCRYPDELVKISLQAKGQGKVVVGFAGSDWNMFFIRAERALIAIPIKNKAGQFIGSIAAERSLVPIYVRYRQELWLAMSYLLINVTIFISLMYFRLERILFRPLERLVQLTDDYRPEQHSLLLMSDDESAFRKLSISFNALLDRIESDNRKLRRTVKELEQANLELKEKKDLVVRSEKLASVGRLSAGLAHEIGNPLSIIQGYIELLSRGDITTEEKLKFSDKALQELDRIKKLIRQLLDFARPMHSIIGSLSANTVIADMADIVRMEKSVAGCNIVTRLLAEDDQIRIEEDAFRQILINCILNAADAISENGKEDGEIVIETSNEVSSTLGRVFAVNIQDNGVGIDAGDLKYIFDPFFTTKEVGRGTGLGLFVCHAILESLGGSISVRNRAPAGIVAKLEFPLFSDSVKTNLGQV